MHNTTIPPQYDLPRLTRKEVKARLASLTEEGRKEVLTLAVDQLWTTQVRWLLTDDPTLPINDRYLLTLDFNVAFGQRSHLPKVPVQTSLLSKAAAHNNTQLATILLKAGANPLGFVMTPSLGMPQHCPLRCALEHRAPSCVLRLLLEALTPEQLAFIQAPTNQASLFKLALNLNQKMDITVLLEKAQFTPDIDDQVGSQLRSKYPDLMVDYERGRFRSMVKEFEAELESQGQGLVSKSKLRL